MTPEKAATTQDAQKAEVGRAATEFVRPDTIIGVGTGTTVAYFIDALGQMPQPIRGAVSSSDASTRALRDLGIEVLDADDVDGLDVYIDGADEVDPQGCLIKGGGGALTREKIVASLAQRFVCIVDGSKRVDVLGDFGIPVEIIPMAREQLTRAFAKGVGGVQGEAVLRHRPDGSVFVTDNGLSIIDIRGAHVDDPLAFEAAASALAGVVTVGVFARQRASLALVGGPSGVTRIDF